MEFTEIKVMTEQGERELNKTEGEVIMMKLLLAFILSLVFVLAAFCAPEVQIATERDEKGKFVNAAALTVDWEMEIDGVTYKEYAEADVPDPYSTDDDCFQEWYVLKPKAADLYWKFTFTRAIKGEYAVRWRAEPEGLWSKWSSCTIERVKPPKQGG